MFVVIVSVYVCVVIVYLIMYYAFVYFMPFRLSFFPFKLNQPFFPTLFGFSVAFDIVFICLSSVLLFCSIQFIFQFYFFFVWVRMTHITLRLSQMNSLFSSCSKCYAHIGVWIVLVCDRLKLWLWLWMCISLDQFFFFFSFILSKNVTG